MTDDTSKLLDLPRQFISVDGSINLRDFGGYTNNAGQIVKKGSLFRCGAMSDIPPHAFDDFAALDIGVICDLRSIEEVDSAPTPTSSPFDCRVHIPIWPGSSNQFQDSVSNKEAGPKKADFIEFMRLVTRDIARDHVEAYKQLIKELMDTERGFLLHCSAGKDRTGFGAAIILTILGVDHDTVMHDYLVSNESSELFLRMRSRMENNILDKNLDVKIDDEIIRVLSGVRAEYLTGAFEEIDQHYGGIDGYLEAIGVTAAEKAHLEARLLTH